MFRSMLFVPGDSEKKLSRAETVPADALIVDLEDSVAPERKAAARRGMSEFLAHRAKRDGPSLWVRINPMNSPEAALDIDGLHSAPPEGIVLPKGTPEDVKRLAGQLDRLEGAVGSERGGVKIMPLATETPSSLFTLGDYADPAVAERLAALTWGAEDLCVALGAGTNVDEHGGWLPTYQLARSLCLLAAHAASVAAIDTIHRDFRDTRGLRLRAAEARRDGFAGKLAIHPAQVEIINDAFRPTEKEIADARRVVQAFGRMPQAGVVALDDQMLDMPHLRHAERVLQLAGESVS